MNYQAIKLDVSDGQGRLTLNRPEKLNSFTTEMHAEIAHAIGRVSAGTDDVRVLVISGAGRAFCAGQDLSEGQMSGSGPVDLGETVERFYAPLVRSLQALSVPVVAAVNGVAAGAGANLALACDIVIAAKSATFLQPFTKLGLLPDTGGTHFLPRLVGSARAMGLSLLAPRVSAEQAADWGMIWKAVPDSDFADEVDALAANLAKGPTVAFARTKRALQGAHRRPSRGIGQAARALGLHHPSRLVSVPPLSRKEVPHGSDPHPRHHDRRRRQLLHRQVPPRHAHLLAPRPD